jgi:NAD(P)-dependent dehydrogenase (short-subunit alcohol dehydrogenase family)
LGRTALGIPADLTDVSQVVKIIERAIAEHGRLDILVNNAGGAMPARWLASPAASYITGKIIEIDGGAEAPVFPDDTPDLRPANKQ